MGTRCKRIHSSSAVPAISVRAAMNVTGGMVATPILMNVYDAPQSVDSVSSNAMSMAVFGALVVVCSGCNSGASALSRDRIDLVD